MPPLKKSVTNILTLMVCVMAGFWLGQTVAFNPGLITKTPLPDVLAKLAPGAVDEVKVLRDVWDAIHRQYVNENINDQTLVQGAIQGLVKGLDDPYTLYLTPAEAKAFAQDIGGVFEGVGMEIGKKKDKLTVIAPLPNSPAAAAGLQAGDVIISVDGKDVSSISADEAVSLIRGPQGTTVTIMYQRGTTDPNSVKLTRAKITIDPVNTKTITVNDKKIRYIQVTNFNEKTDRLFRQAAAAGIDERAAGYIIDLRNNPGGYLDQAVKVASAVVTDGTIVTEVTRDKKHHDIVPDGTAILSGQKIIVLINRGSASASEIVAGAWQDRKFATLVGEKTYGKGSVQELRELPDGSNLKLTVAKWLTPNGRSISDEGITPDIAVTLTEANYNANQDPQLDRAKDLIINP